MRAPGLYWAHLAACILLALVLAAVVRSATAELSQLAGHVWPFSAARCAHPAPSTCSGGTRLTSARQPGGYGTFAR